MLLDEMAHQYGIFKHMCRYQSDSRTGDQNSLIERSIITSCSKVGFAQLGKSLSVKGGLQVLERESIVEDDAIVNSGSSLGDRMRPSQGRHAHADERGDLHLDRVFLNEQEPKAQRGLRAVKSFVKIGFGTQMNLVALTGRGRLAQHRMIDLSLYTPLPPHVVMSGLQVSAHILLHISPSSDANL
jgi:hypothetical protein